MTQDLEIIVMRNHVVLINNSTDSMRLISSGMRGTLRGTFFGHSGCLCHVFVLNGVLFRKFSDGSCCAVPLDWILSVDWIEDV